MQEEPHAARILEGFTAALAEKGYAPTTIADIVAKARVSKRTFYEHFEDKEACLLAAYRAATSAMMEAMAAAFDANAARPWPEQVEAVIDAYVTALESTPSLTRTCLVEMAAAGPRALELLAALRGPGEGHARCGHAHGERAQHLCEG